MLKLGKHFLVEYYGCDPELLDDENRIKDVLLEAAKRCGATVLEHSFHKFAPQGVSGVVVIAESHISIHTWPEYGYAAVDIFTCGTTVEPLVAYKYIKEALRSKETLVREIDRGEIRAKVEQGKERIDSVVSIVK